MIERVAELECGTKSIADFGYGVRGIPFSVMPPGSRL